MGGSIESDCLTMRHQLHRRDRNYWSSESVTDLLQATAPGLAMLEAILLTGTVTEAARLCGVSQPTLTRAMSRWEVSAGTALFDRSCRAIRWTVQGRELAQLAASTLAALRTTLRADNPRSSSSSLSIGSLHCLGQAVVIELIAEYLDRRPSPSVRLVESSSAEIYNAVRSGTIDLAIVDKPTDLTGFSWRHLGRQSLSLVLPASHPQANNPRVDLADFKDHQFVALDNRFQSRIHADAVCAEAGFYPRIVLESNEPARLREYVGDGRGIAILPVDLSISPRIRYLHLGSPLAVCDFGVLTIAQNKDIPRVRDFIAHVEALEKRYPDWADLLDH